MNIIASQSSAGGKTMEGTTKFFYIDEKIRDMSDEELVELIKKENNKEQRGSYFLIYPISQI